MCSSTKFNLAGLAVKSGAYFFSSVGFMCEQPKRQPQPDFFLKNWAIRVTLCVKGAYLSQLSFPQIVISFSTWQAEQKKLGKEDVCICCTVSQTYGKRRETAVSVFHAVPACYTLTSVETLILVQMSHCCIAVYFVWVGLLQCHAGDVFMFLVRGEDLTGEAEREKAERPGQCHTRPGQFVGEIGATNCRLHRLKPETLVWSAGLCHIPDNRHRAVSVS